MSRKRLKKGSPKFSSSSAGGVGDPYGLNEVDEFASKREKVMLNNSTLAHEEREDYSSNDDEEVMNIDDDIDGDDEEEQEMDGEEAYRKLFGRRLASDVEKEIDEKEGLMLNNDTAWGATKDEYYGADDLEDDETAKEIELEALRQRKKHLEELNINDYMDEELDNEWAKSAKEFDTSEFKQSTLPQNKKKVSIKDILNMNPESQEKHLQVLFPEFLPLCKEFAELSNTKELLENKKEKSEPSYLKLMALSSYLGTLSSYFSILLHELNTNEDFVTMKDHPIMESILTLKELWRQASELPDETKWKDVQLQKRAKHKRNVEIGELGGNEDGGNSEGESNNFGHRMEEENEQQENEDEENNNEENNEDENDEDENDEDENDEDENDEDEDDLDLDDFEEYVKHSRISKVQPEKISVYPERLREDHDDYIEEEMADIDAQEKKARKRTLRFYTSKIDQEETKKIDRLKGDDDVPYKERLYERQQRLLEEARNRAQKYNSKESDLDNGDYRPEDEAISQAINEESEKDYFSQVLREKQFRQHTRQQFHKDAVKAAKEGKLAELAEGMDEEGKRAISYQILKNKGLTPKRKKENRNARVKKRKRYDKAQKKLKSVRAVYAGGLSGPYEGEKTGIKKNLTKSVKFSN